MDGELRNLLYRRPELYEHAVHYGAEHESAHMCERLFERHLAEFPRSLLDIGSGTGRDLEYLASRCPDCLGIDFQESMVAFSRRRRPQIEFRVGDMRSLRLGRTFAAITCLGYAIANVHSNDDVARSFATFAAHAVPGTLLVIDAINALCAPDGGTLPRQFAVASSEFNATATATYRDDCRNQLVIRERQWAVQTGEHVHDFARLRTLAPMELEHHLAAHGFETLAIYDNRELVETDLRGTNLFAVARFEGPRSRQGTRS